ncbi:MAG: amidohydrolase family protein [Vicinamibacteraceae bacterium]
MLRLFGSLVLFAAALLVATPARVLAQPIAIVGGRVHPVSGPVIENGTVIIDGGRITAVGASVPLPVGARVVDAKGKWVTPGLVNALTTLGLSEVDAVASTNDASAQGEAGIAAALRAWDGLNPASVLWTPARNEGVTSVVAVPTGGLIAGQAAFVDTLGETRVALVRRAPVAMVANLTATTAEAKSRGDLLMRLRQLLDDARTYGLKKVAFERAATRHFVVSHIHLEALQPVLAGKLPLLVAVDRAADIQSLLDLAKDYRLRVIVQGGAEAWRVAPALAAAKVPVLVSALDNIPGSFDALGTRQENAALLRRAGVPVVITAGAIETFNVRNVKQHAGNAVAYGLPWDEALRAVTLAPAEAFGVADTVGSLAVGKAANVVVWSGDPFEFSTRAEHVYVRGVEHVERSRQDLLSDRYKTPGRE